MSRDFEAGAVYQWVASMNLFLTSQLDMKGMHVHPSNIPFTDLHSNVHPYMYIYSTRCISIVRARGCSKLGICSLMLRS